MATKREQDGAAAESNLATLVAPDGATGISVAGVQYDVDPRTGTVQVAHEHVADCYSHGYKAKSAKRD